MLYYDFNKNRVSNHAKRTYRNLVFSEDGEKY